ncbi:MAG TPA: DEAD/DEAH box helicase, partial [Polyangiaceae bacterium]|nr:DEAD/DEAH box helicase [Polyangiaceae bacterium]
MTPKPAPWVHDTGVDVVVDRWLDERSVIECFAADRTVAAAGAEYAAVPPSLDGRLVRALEKRGITRLYAHQERAIAAALGGSHVITATPTA